MRRPIALALLVVLPALMAGCASTEGARATLVPYPRLGDVATYDATGALVEFSRWNNAVPLVANPAQVRFTLAPSESVLDGARAVHHAFQVRLDVSEGGPFVKRSERYVSPAHQAIVQAWYPINQKDSVVAFDERGYPWLFGASVLFGEDLSEARHEFLLPDNLGRDQPVVGAWVRAGEESVGETSAVRFDLADVPGLEGSLWMEPGSAWPVQVRLAITGEEALPLLRSDGALPAVLEARRVEMLEGQEPLPPRNRGATFTHDASVERARWDGEKPPDGDAASLPYLLSEAVRDAKLLDPGLQEFLRKGGDPRVYRGSFQVEPGPVENSLNALWLVQFVNDKEEYYEVQVGRYHSPSLPTGGSGIPHVESSGPAKPPGERNHGWFAAADVPEEIVPLSEGMRVVREVFGANDIQIFLRSFADPAGYSYYLDGGVDVGARYTVVYNPETAFIEQVTGPMTVRYARG